MTKHKKKWVTKRIAKGMVELSEIFKDKRKVQEGLKRDEILSLMMSKPLDKVVIMNLVRSKTEWNKIRTIKQHLIRTEQMAIIHKSMEKGTSLYCDEFGIRVLDKRTNIFFRCVTTEDGWIYRNKLDAISRGVEKTADKITSIVEQEEDLINEREVMQVIKSR